METAIEKDEFFNFIAYKLIVIDSRVAVEVVNFTLTKKTFAVFGRCSCVPGHSEESEGSWRRR